MNALLFESWPLKLLFMMQSLAFILKSLATISTFFNMDINDWRIRIDEVTDELIALLNQRASFATEIGKIKKQKGLPVFDASRENAVLEVVASKAEVAGGPLTPDSFKRIFQVIMEETRKVEE